MRPFNLDAAKADAPVQTEHGAPVRLICYDRKAVSGGLRVLGLVDNGMGGENIGEWTLGGVALDATGGANLVMAPTERSRTVWINVYPLIYPGSGSVQPHGSREEADKWARDDRLACINAVLKWEE